MPVSRAIFDGLGVDVSGLGLEAHRDQTGTVARNASSF